ncbi:Clavaminate synthase-like protein [Whalleya microplaca]|nr:Clavaminate synthase-like protein [Whalleya microplaca]
MASSKLFEGIPAFPDDIPIAQISTISLSGLRAGDASVAESLLSSAQNLGFFLLDLREDDIGNNLIEEVDSLFDLSKVVMNLPSDIKQKYRNDPPRSFLGYKAQGGSKTETMEPDRFEWFNIGQDGLTGCGTLQPLPEPMNVNLPLLKSFLEHGQDIIQMVCRILATQLNLPSDSFTSLQPLSKPSGTVIRFIKAYACPSAEDLRTSMVHHTDFGTITLLANVVGGLQILEPRKSTKEPDAWSWVRPQPGCLIVNLGDAMVEWTGGLLRSNVHRIRYPPGQQRFLDRYSVAILARPERNAIMKDLVRQDGGSNGDNSNLTAWEWEVKKSSALARGEDTVESKGGRS